MYQEATRLRTEVSLDRGVYDALAAVDTVAADAGTRYYLRRTLRGFRLAGVDRDSANRARIRALQDTLTTISLEFENNLQNDSSEVAVSGAAELAGLPADYVARHRPGADGRIHLTLAYPDVYPVLQYARSDDLRRRMQTAFLNRAYPRNYPVLERLLARRAELAHLLGFRSWAEYALADKMAGSVAVVRAFLSSAIEASDQPARREYAQLLARKRRDVPDAHAVGDWERRYLLNQVRQAGYSFDPAEARQYFPFERVKMGVLDVTGRLFGLAYRPAVGVPVWDPSVEVVDVMEGGRVLGRLYLDLHPREGKYTHCAAFDIRWGAGGRQLPEAALVCNLPGGQPGDPGLMEMGDITSFFHEFGHLLHFIFSGRAPWVGESGYSTETDFVEAPSQFLEEWTRNPMVLAGFSRHVQTGEPIPADLARRIARANELGKALGARNAIGLSLLSLEAYDRPPAEVNLDSLDAQTIGRVSLIERLPGTHFPASFGHLDGYSAVYYSYLWSLTIAKDLYGRFDPANPLDPAVAGRYRDAVLAPGASAPASALVARFLGRPTNTDAWRAWLTREP